MKKNCWIFFISSIVSLNACKKDVYESKTVSVEGYVKDICTQDPLGGIEVFLSDSCCCGVSLFSFGVDNNNDDCTFESVLTDENGYYYINEVIGTDTDVDRFRIRINGNLWWENDYPLIDEYIGTGHHEMDIFLPPRGYLGVKVNLLSDTLITSGWQIGNIYIESYELENNGDIWYGARAGIKNYVKCEVFNHNYTPTQILYFSDSVFVGCDGDTTYYEFNL